MIKLLSEELEAIINEAWEDAANRDQEYLLLENILLTSIGTKEVQEMMNDLDVDWKKLSSEIETFLNKEVDTIPNGSHPKQTLMFKKILQHLIFHSQNSGKIAQIEDLLIAMFNEAESNAVYLMTKYGIDEYSLKEYATEIRHPDEEEDEDEDEDEEMMTPRNPREKKKKKSALEEFAINLTQMAKDGKIDPVIGRDEECERAIQILCRKKKNNPLLVGEAGVGKCLRGTHNITVQVNDALLQILQTL